MYRFSHVLLTHEIKERKIEKRNPIKLSKSLHHNMSKPNFGLQSQCQKRMAKRVTQRLKKKQEIMSNIRIYVRNNILLLSNYFYFFTFSVSCIDLMVIRIVSITFFNPYSWHLVYETTFFQKQKEKHRKNQLNQWWPTLSKIQ